MANRNRTPELERLVEPLCKTLARFEPARLWRETKKLDMHIGVFADGSDGTLTYKRPREIFVDAAAVAEALASRTSEAKQIAFPLLASLDPEAALKPFNAFLEADFTGAFDNMSYGASVCRSVSTAWDALVALQPPHVLAKLFVEGKVELEGMPRTALAAVKPDALVVAIRDDKLGWMHRGDARAVIEANPKLRTERQLVELLEAIQTTTEQNDAQQAFTTYLLERLVEAGCRDVIPTVTKLVTSEFWVSPTAIAAALALRHEPMLRLMAAPLAKLAKRKLAWDPHHVDLELATPIRASFALAPESASTTFAPYFTPKALTSESGAKVAHDILSIGMSVLVDHDGTRLGTGDRDWLESDPGGWFAIASGLSKHRLLKKIAKQIRARAPKHKPPARKRRRRA